MSRINEVVLLFWFYPKYQNLILWDEMLSTKVSKPTIRLTPTPSLSFWYNNGISHPNHNHPPAYFQHQQPCSSSKAPVSLKRHTPSQIPPSPAARE